MSSDWYSLSYLLSCNEKFFFSCLFLHQKSAFDWSILKEILASFPLLLKGTMVWFRLGSGVPNFDTISFLYRTLTLAYDVFEIWQFLYPSSTKHYEKIVEFLLCIHCKLLLNIFLLIIKFYSNNCVCFHICRCFSYWLV